MTALVENEKLVIPHELGSDVTRQLNSHGRLARSANNTQEIIVHRFKYVISAALLAISQLAIASEAEVKISNLTLSTSGGELWYWVPSDVTWVSKTSGTSGALLPPALNDSAVAWHGNTLSTLVTDQQSFAQAGITATTPGDLNGVSAIASVQATGGQSGWAFAKVFDGQLMVSGHTTFTVSATLSGIHASGSTAQANAYIELCSTDFTTDTCDSANYVEAFVDASSPLYSGPTTLTTSWTNPGDTTWIKMHIGLTASADSVTAVPEPATMALWLAGLAGVGARLRRRKD